MDAFWKWLMRTNARWVFYCALAALLLVIAWWTWKELSPLEPEAVIPASALKDNPPPVLGIDALLDGARSKAPLEVPVNVFVALEPLRAPKTDPTANVTPNWTQPPTLNPTVKPPGEAQPPPPPVKPRDTLRLTYRGLLRRPDGKTVALIEDSKSKGSAFYPVSTNDLFGVGKLATIDTNRADLILKDGSVIPLMFGTNVLFEGGNRVN